MISEIRIRNFKSIEDLVLKLGRVTVLVGENGSGKSNILEAIAFAACAAASKLDGEFLVNRGVRVTEATWMKAAFPLEDITGRRERIRFSVKGTGEEPRFECDVQQIKTQDTFYRWGIHCPVWQNEIDEALKDDAFVEEMAKELERLKTSFELNLSKASAKTKASSAQKQTTTDDHDDQKWLRLLTAANLSAEKRKNLPSHASLLKLLDFIIYAPENTTLRNPPPESVVQPLGTKGEGLFKLLQSFGDPKSIDRLHAIKENLRLFGWFGGFDTPTDAATAQARLKIHDRWLASESATFDQRSASEGFLYLLFYFTLLMSPLTPPFFAIDNVDIALNPKVCAKLMTQIVALAKQYDKQVICTTHNPAILDGLNINDDEQRLYTVRRSSEGRTALHRVPAPQPQQNELPVRLSEAFTRGLIGGLPDNF